MQLLSPETIANFLVDRLLDGNHSLSPKERAGIKIAVGIVLESATPRQSIGKSAAIGLITTGVLDLLGVKNELREVIIKPLVREVISYYSVISLFDVSWHKGQIGKVVES